MPDLVLLLLIGLQCFVDGEVPATVAKCVIPSDVRYTLKVGESQDFRFGQEPSDSDNQLVSNSNFVSNGSSSSIEPPAAGHCGVSISGCFHCHLKITFLSMRLPSCYTGRDCRCNYVSLVEPEYAKSRREFCGYQENSSLSYQSKTKLVTLEFVYDDPSDSSFTIRVQAFENQYTIQGQGSNSRGNRSGHFESPYFPSRYPSDFTATYNLQNSDPKGFVMIVFTDFLLSPWSYIKVEDGNKSELHTFNGNVFRPPAIISPGPNMTVIFKANDEYPNPGFRVKYTFLNYPDIFLMKIPVTECGGYVDDYGGTVSLGGTSVDPLQGYDCVWIIKPRITDETHLSLRVTQFQDMGPKSELSIRQGLTSRSDLLDTLSAFGRFESNAGPPTQEFVVNVETGFYLRFQGHLNNRSRLAIIYTAFKFESCNQAKDFRCASGRCIKPLLHCDGFNHCGDGSDEVACYGNVGTLSPEDSTWWRLTPNYFPKTDGSGAGGGTNTLILITSLAGLGMFVLTTALILVKLHKQRREDTATRHMLRTVSADIEASPRLPHNSAGEPPLYDPPPSYEDVIKFYLPPPPTYTSLATSRGHRPTVSVIGMDNSGFVPDTVLDASTPRHQQHGRSVSALPQSLLAVILPSRALSRSSTSLNAGKLNSTTEAFSLDLSVTEANRSQNFQKQESNLGDLLLDLSTPTGSPESPPPPYEAQPSGESKVAKCSCQGACSCPSSRQDTTENHFEEENLSVTNNDYTQDDGVVIKTCEASTSAAASQSFEEQALPSVVHS